MSATVPTYDELPPKLISNVRGAYEEDGDAWLHRLPVVLAGIADRWSLTLLPPFPGLSFNYVAPVTLTDGAPAVLKVGVPHRERNGEIRALEIYNGDGMPRLLASDVSSGAALMEQIFPGTPLAGTDDDKATHIAAGIVRRGWRTVDKADGLIPVMTWFDDLGDLRTRYSGGSGPFSEFALAQAERLSLELTATAGEPMLIHGDFHHYNIIRSGNGWTAIDPKGMLGDPSFDFAMFLMNPLDFRDWPDWETRLIRRLDIFTAEGFDRARIAGWLRAFSVLSNWWSVVGDDPTLPSRLAFVERIARMEL